VAQLAASRSAASVVSRTHVLGLHGYDFGDVTRRGRPAYSRFMSTAPVLAPPSRVEDPDQRVILNGIDWWQFETFLAIRGDRPGVRVTYLEGQLEIMSPSQSHEMLAKMIARLLEAYAEEKGLVFEGYKSMTMRNAPKLRGI